MGSPYLDAHAAMTGSVYMEAVFAFALTLIFYAYFGYPISLYVAGCFSTSVPGKRVEAQHKVTVVTTAYNEENRIREKLRDTLSANHDGGDLQILVVSDGSTDRTNGILGEYALQGVQPILLKERSGKENAQREALQVAVGDIIVFTDVSTMLGKEAVTQIVSNFSDLSIGCVSSEDRVIGKDGKVSGENLYVRYEMWLRRLESRVSSPVGLSGSFFAARKSVCDNFSSEMDSDFRTLLNCVGRGLRGTVDPKAIGYYRDLSSQQKEFDRKVRTVLRGLTVFFRSIEFLNFFKYGIFSYQLFCHKLLRWLVPFLLIALFVVNIPLAASSPVYAVLLGLQCLFYAMAAMSIFFDLYASRWVIAKIPVYFVTVNASILVAWLRYLGGQRVLVWTPSER